MLAVATLALFAALDPSTTTVTTTTDGVVHEVVDQVRPVLVTTLVGVAILVLGLVAWLARTLVGSATKALGGLFDDRSWRSAMGKLDEAATTAIDAAEQTLVEALRDAEPRGVLTAEQGRQALAEALRVGQGHFGPAVWDAIAVDLKMAAPGVLGLLQSKIEAALHRRKADLAATEPEVTGTVTVGEATMRATGPSAAAVGETLASLRNDGSETRGG